MVFAADWSSFFSERKVDIRSMDADFWKVHNGHVAALTVDRIPPLSGHLQPNSPSILAWIVGGLLCDEITVKEDDWNLGELHELLPPETGSHCLVRMLRFLAHCRSLGLSPIQVRHLASESQKPLARSC
jgi:hypothetical protein